LPYFLILLSAIIDMATGCIYYWPTENVSRDLISDYDEWTLDFWLLKIFADFFSEYISRKNLEFFIEKKSRNFSEREWLCRVFPLRIIHSCRSVNWVVRPYRIGSVNWVVHSLLWASANRIFIQSPKLWERDYVKERLC
jgi:hypothetical protein